MVTRKKAAMRLHGLMVRYTPAMWSFFVLVPMIPFLTFLRFTDPATWFASVGFWLAGFVFIYDGITIWPEKGKVVGYTSAIVIMFLGGLNVFLGAIVFAGWFNPFVGTSDWIPVASISLGLGVVALFVSGTIEIWLGKHYGKELKAKLSGR